MSILIISVRVCVAGPPWAVAALCVVSLCVVLSFAVCVGKKCLKKKDKEKDKKKGKDKTSGGSDTEMDGGYSEVSYTHTHTPLADVLSLQCIDIQVLQDDSHCQGVLTDVLHNAHIVKVDP